MWHNVVGGMVGYGGMLGIAWAVKRVKEKERGVELAKQRLTRLVGGYRQRCPFRLLPVEVPGIDKAVQRLEADRACDLGRLWAVAVYRVSSVGFACGVFRGDGFGDEYGGGGS